ncbi:GerMN domain-containing protein [Clostridiaceae bacterium M8S5]|nr:GerMN domain-containing protein [Clostridiaceae bacterium M8S5]
MKKIMIVAMIIILSMSLMIGCSKEDETSDANKNNDVNKIKDNEDKNNSPEEGKESTDNTDIDYVLFLKEKGYPNIVSQTMSIKSNDERLKTKTIKEIALQHLIDFGEFNGLVSPIPSGTKLLGLKIDGNKAIVDFSKEFQDNMKGDVYNTMLSLAGVINTLTVAEDIEKVVFTINGQTINNLNGVDMTKEFEYNVDFFPDK